MISCARSAVGRILPLCLLLSQVAGAGPCPTGLEWERTIAAARERSAELLRKRDTRRLEETLINPFPPGGLGERRSVEQWRVVGVPDFCRPLAAESRVFRHYTPDAETLARIVETKSLLNGFTSYLEGAPGLWVRTYDDLSGVFLTWPETPITSNLMVVDNANYFVDFTLDPRIPVLALNHDIFLVPLPRRFRPWMLEKYRRYLAGETLSKDDLATATRIATEGGGEEYPLPIQIVRYGKVP